MNIDDLVEVLREKQIDSKVIDEIVDELKTIQKEKKEDTTPKQKNQFVVLASSPTNELSNAEAWVAQIKEGDDPNAVVQKVETAMKDYNANTRKGRKNPLKNFAESCQYLPRKFLKKHNVLLKTKESVQLVKLA